MSNRLKKQISHGETFEFCGFNAMPIIHYVFVYGTPLPPRELTVVKFGVETVLRCLNFKIMPYSVNAKLWSHHDLIQFTGAYPKLMNAIRSVTPISR